MKAYRKNKSTSDISITEACMKEDAEEAGTSFLHLHGYSLPIWFLIAEMAKVNPCIAAKTGQTVCKLLPQHSAI